MTEPDETAPRVLFIGGTGRTGSTVLDALLGAFPGVFSGGELAFFWRFGLGGAGRCSCGERLTECPVWSAILDAAFGDEGVVAERMVDLRRRFWSLHLPLMPFPAARRNGLARLEEFPAVVERLYRAIGRSTGARLIVDSSKEPHYSYILREATELDVYFLHLVRDPRAVGMSWRRPRREAGLDGDARMERRGILKTSAYYGVSNAAAEMLWRTSDNYAFLRYEDFVARPHDALAAIGRFVGVDFDVGSVLDEQRSFERRELHSAWGNPNRFDRGRTTLRADDAWVEQLDAPRRAALTALNGPLAYRYGYPLRSRSRHVGEPHGRPSQQSLGRGR